jgi:hypothetical protein
MSYVPPQKRVTKAPKESKALPKNEFPELGKEIETKDNVTKNIAKTPEHKMNFAALFKNVLKKKNRVKKLKWGTVLLTKNGMIDSLTPEEREAEEKWKDEAVQEARMLKVYSRMIQQQDIRREYDPHYESPDEWIESESEEEEEEEEVLTEDEEEDEFEPEI